MTVVSEDMPTSSSSQDALYCGSVALIAGRDASKELIYPSSALESSQDIQLLTWILPRQQLPACVALADDDSLKLTMQMLPGNVYEAVL